jgi:hypothetical protein
MMNERKDVRTMAMNHVVRAFTLLALSAALGDGACDKSPSRVRCTGEADTMTCKSPEECAWIHDGAGYFCASLCAGGACSSGHACKTGAASSCQTCQDLLDICE